MGRYKFRLTDMMPNSWFYKLKDTSRATTTKHPSTRLLNNPKPTPATKNQQSNSNSFPQTDQLYIPNRPSCYISSNRPQTEHLPTSPAHPKASDTHFPLDPPRKSMKNHRHLHRRSNNNNSDNNNPANSLSSSASTAPKDIIIDMKSLPPIHTKPPAKKKEAELDGKEIMLRRRRAQQGLHRIKVRPSCTPKAEVKRSRKVGSSRRLAESVVIVKKSADPKRDFKESMVEMIAEYHIRGPKDLEELLACYLSLNSDEYHGVIVKVFEEIWIDLVKQ